jgi:hypothetical protein
VPRQKVIFISTSKLVHSKAALQKESGFFCEKLITQADVDMTAPLLTWVFPAG